MPLFGDNSVTLGGNGATDSYNSGDGDYGERISLQTGMWEQMGMKKGP